MAWHMIDFFYILSSRLGLSQEPGFDSMGASSRKSSQARLLCFVVTAIAKLATCHSELLPRARVSLAKVLTLSFLYVINENFRWCLHHPSLYYFSHSILTVFPAGCSFPNIRQESLATCLWLFRAHEWTSHLFICTGTVHCPRKWSWYCWLVRGRNKDGSSCSLLPFSGAKR